MHLSKVSIAVSGIRIENWQTLLDSVASCIGPHEYEFIFCGPYAPSEKILNDRRVRYVKDMGNPSRALQVASLLAEGEYLTWAVDDGIFLPKGLENAIPVFDGSKQIVNLVYTEGVDYLYGRDLRLTNPDVWFNYRHHDEIRNLIIPPSYLYSILYLMRTQDFYDLGGLDCAFEGINLNLHDLSYRAQKGGYKITHSMTPYQRIDWQQGGPSRYKDPIYNAYFENDRPLFWKYYMSEENFKERPVSIDINNWRLQEQIWSRKWGANLTT